jgi:hypothetical protein
MMHLGVQQEMELLLVQVILQESADVSDKVKSRTDVTTDGAELYNMIAEQEQLKLK